MNILLLGSKSRSRQELLKESEIPFALAEQDADESKCDWGLPLTKLVRTLALYKMESTILPEEAEEGDIIFVLTADTLSQDKDGTIQGKPKSREDAVAKIRGAREGSRLATAFCLDRKIFKNGAWLVDERIEEVVVSEYLFYVPEYWLERYIEDSRTFTSSNAIAVEVYGSQFLKEVNGSYSTIVGLPMFEVREALDKLGFFSC